MKRLPSYIESIQDFCLHVLQSTSLEDKLMAPRLANGDFLSDRLATHASGSLKNGIFIDAPERSAEIAFSQHKLRSFPAVKILDKSDNAAVCMDRFAQHELMAVELFSWALLAYPLAPLGLRKNWIRAIEEEQQHCTLYVNLLKSRGHFFGEFGVTNYFWRIIATSETEEKGILSFLATMGLTLEQANLDFSLYYRDAFYAIDDQETGQILQNIHDDEIQHVAFAAKYFARLKPENSSFVETYQQEIPYPLTAVRAKGRRFNIEARRKAKLPMDMITYVQHKKP